MVENETGLMPSIDADMPIEEVKAAEEKPKQVINMKLKGKEITAADLTKVPAGYCIQRLVPKEDMPVVHNYKLKLPQFFISDSCIKGPKPSAGNPDLMQATIFSTKENKFLKSQIYIPSDMPLKILEGTYGKEKSDKFEEHRVANMSSYLGLSTQIGTDPEIFVTTGKGAIMPAFTFLAPKPKEIVTPDKMNRAYNDGFQAEFETPPQTCLAYLTDRIHDGLLKVYVEAKKKDGGARLSRHSVVETPVESLAKFTKDQVALGCAPSVNVYGLTKDLGEPETIPYRFSGGHIHLGLGKREPQIIEAVVKSLDAILGVCAVSMAAGFDNPVRRQYYGLPGEYRVPPHGIEYRTLSNYWLIHPVVTHLTFDLARKAAAFGLNGMRKYYKATDEEVIKCITECDVDLAHEIMDRNKDIILALFKACYPTSYEEAFQAFRNGLGSFVATPDDIIKNWNLKGQWASHSNNPQSQWATACKSIKEGKKI